MSIRNLLHCKHLEGFSEWMQTKGWDIVPTKGVYEVIRFTKDGKLMTIYQTDSSQEHYSIENKDKNNVLKYLSHRRKTVGDVIER